MDFSLISETLFTDVDEANVLPGDKTDHSIILLSLDFGKFQKRHSYWKMNNSLLKDITYAEEIKSKIKSIKQQYGLKHYAHYENINEVPLDDIQFSINDQLFLN